MDRASPMGGLTKSGANVKVFVQGFGVSFGLVAADS
jgi:hypothetical protein